MSLSRHKKNLRIVIVMFIILIVLIGIKNIIQYFYTPRKQNNTNISQNVHELSPTLTSYQQIYNTTKTIPPEIIIMPIRRQEFDYEVVGLNNCGRPEGLVTYSEKTQVSHEGEESHMAINSTKLKGTSDSQKGMDELENLLLTPVKENQDLYPIENAFNAYCDSGAVNVIKELNGIYYPGMQQSKVVMAFFAQSQFPDVFIYVFGKKNNNYIRLVKRVVEFNRDKFMKNCQTASNDFDKQNTCYEKAVFIDKELEQIAIREANNLISTFKIK